MFKLTQRIHYRWSVLRSQHPFSEIQIKRPIEWFGNPNAGFYVDPQHIRDQGIIYSLGVGNEVSFDLALIKKFGVHIYAYDPTPATVEWIRLQNLPPEFHFYPYAVGGTNGMSSFYPPPDSTDVSFTVYERPDTKKQKILVPMKSLLTLVRENLHSYIDLLKIDIEGSEYDLLSDILVLKDCIQQIAIEFHHSNVYAPDMAYKSRTFIKKLNKAGYACIGICNHREYTFLKQP